MDDTRTPALDGYHHLTMVCADARENARFYTDLLKLRLVKKTVNFDLPDTYHLYYGDRAGSPGTILTFFEWPDRPAGNTGWGGIHHIAMSVASGAALAYWRGRLEREGVAVEGPFDDHGLPTIRFRDPDGLIVELCAPAGDDVPDGAPDLWVDSLAIGPIHHSAAHVTDREAAATWYGSLLGFTLTGEAANYDDPSLTDLIFDAGEGQRVIVTPVARTSMPQAHEGAGQTHHIAFNLPDDPAELAWQSRLEAAGVLVSEVRGRKYFRSIYFNDPDGLLIEIATAVPGFAVDEPPESLGQRLSLPPQYEDQRAELERTLKPLR